jgi:hypothetical protein
MEGALEGDTGIEGGREEKTDDGIHYCKRV